MNTQNNSQHTHPKTGRLGRKTTKRRRTSILIFISTILIIIGIAFLFTSRIPSNDVQAISVGEDGVVWIATNHDGVSKFNGRSWTTYDEEDGLVSTDFSQKRYIAVAPDGTVWYSGGLGVYRFDGQTWRHYTRSDGLIDDSVQAISVGPSGEAWIGTRHGVTLIKGSHIQNFTYQDGLVSDFIASISASPGGDVWFVGYFRGVSHLDGKTMTNYTTVNSGLVSNDIRDIAANENGEVWFSTTGSGVFVFDGQKWHKYSQKDGMVRGSAWGGIAFAEDGSVWIGGKDGASRYKNGQWTKWNTDNGLAGNYLQGGIAAAPNGDVWFASNHGVSRFDGNKWTTYSENSGFGWGIGLIVLAVILLGAGSLWIQRIPTDRTAPIHTGTPYSHDAEQSTPVSSVSQVSGLDRRDKMEIKTARWWYRWLWMSPLLTIPTLIAIYLISYDFVYVMICPQGWQGCNHATAERILTILAVIISSLWHLLLLIPSLDKKNQFVRWHGRQAMILAGVRTIVPLVFVSLIDDSITSLVFILVLLPIWFFGTYWGQQQAARGDCSLMRWTGREYLLPGPPPNQETSGLGSLSDETLENTFRFSKDRQEREAALEELEKRGLVEQL